MTTTVIAAAKSKNVVCNVSVQTTVLIPPLNVYINIKVMKITAGTQKGTPHDLKTNSYSTKTTKYIRIAEPIKREIMKNNAPVFSDDFPNFIPRYVYMEVRFNL